VTAGARLPEGGLVIAGARRASGCVMIAA
jgi:hypothetical protein